MSAPCLHCAIMEAIAGVYRERGDLHGEASIIDADETLAALAACAGGIIGSLRIHDARDAALSAFMFKTLGVATMTADTESGYRELRPS